MNLLFAPVSPPPVAPAHAAPRLSFLVAAAPGNGYFYRRAFLAQSLLAVNVAKMKPNGA